MSRFNNPTIPSGPGSRTTSHEGGTLYRMSDEEALYTTVVNTFLDNKFYEKATDTLHRLQSLARTTDPLFSLRLAVYAREQMYLRSASVVLLAEVLLGQSEGVVRRTGLEQRAVVRVCQRPDDMTELMAYIASRTGNVKKFPHSVRKGIARAFVKFDAYQLGKYKQEGKGLSLKDVMFLTHPKPITDEQAAMFKQFIDGTLPAPDTWEVAISAAGSDPVKKSQTWERLVAEKKLGYMATLRNLRNLLDAGVSDATLKAVADYLSNETAVRNSKQLPIRFYSAYVELTKSTHQARIRPLLIALEKAMALSIKNNPLMGDEKPTLAIFDTSGSMTTNRLSSNSERTCAEVALLMSGLTASMFPNSATMGFATHAAHCNPPTGGVLSWMTGVSREMHRLGGGTDGSKPLQLLIKSKQKYDRVFLYSDMDIHRSVVSMTKLWQQYRSEINPDAKLYIMDLQGYARGTPVSLYAGQNVALISGFSDRIFDMVDSLEQGRSAVMTIKGLDL